MFSALFTRQFSLRAHLHMLVAAVLLPLLVLGLIGMWLAADRLRNDSSQHLTETVLALTRAIDRSVGDTISSLDLLASSEAGVANGPDAAERWRRAWNADAQVWVIREAEAGRQAADLLPPDLFERVRASGAPVISSLYFSTVYPDGPLVAIAVPGRDGRDPVALVQPSGQLINAIAHATQDSRLLVAVVDDQGKIAARSRNRQFEGQLVPGWPRLIEMGTNQGTFETVSREGSEIILAFNKLKNAPGWVLAAGEPLSTFDTRWLNPLGSIALGGLLAVVLALLATQLITRRILEPVRRLTRRGRAVAQGQEILPDDPPSSTVKEFHALEDSFSVARQVLQRRAEDARELARSLQRSERLYRTVAQAGALVFWQADGAGAMRVLTGWTELTGRALAQSLGQGWLQAVHAEERDQVELAWSEALSSGQPLDIEFRVSSATGVWRWVRLRGAWIDATLSPQLLHGSKEPLASEWAGVLEDVNTRRQAQARISYLAHHDPLTGLANRNSLMERLDSLVAARGAGERAALLCLDLDRFKEVNDTLGHPQGDALLCAVAQRLCAQVRRTDLVARLGGDEFAIVQVGIGSPQNVADLATRLQESLCRPYDLGGAQAVIGVSIGIAMFDDAITSPGRLFQCADLALYSAKGGGRGHFRFFEPEMDERMQMRHQLEQDARRAMEAKQFELHYQPMVDVRTKEIQGFEALLRWRHPTRGLLAPAEFLSLLDESRQFDDLGRWVLRQACLDARRWPQPLKVSVNLASIQLDAALHGWVLETLASVDFPPQRLELDMAEQVLIAKQGNEVALASLRKLKQAGVSIVVDDFGSGRSSIGCLRSFPFDKVKIDPSFASELGQGRDNGAFIGAIAQLCGQLGIATVVEGVETQDQLDLIREQACDQAQGYLFGQPMTIGEVDAFLGQAGQGILRTSGERG